MNSFFKFQKKQNKFRNQKIKFCFLLDTYVQIH